MLILNLKLMKIFLILAQIMFKIRLGEVAKFWILLAYSSVTTNKKNMKIIHMQRNVENVWFWKFPTTGSKFSILSLICTFFGSYGGEVKLSQHAYRCECGLSGELWTPVEYVEASLGGTYTGAWHMLRVNSRMKFPMSLDWHIAL